MGRLPKGYSKNSVSEEDGSSRRRSKSKAKKDEVIVQSTKPSKKHQRDRIRSLPVSIQKNLVRIKGCESQRPSPTPENDIFYQQNSNQPSVLRFKNPTFQVQNPTHCNTYYYMYSFTSVFSFKRKQEKTVEKS